MKDNQRRVHEPSRAGSGTRKNSSSHKKKQHSLPFRILKKLVMVIATTLLSLFLVVVITGTIVSTALTVYVLNFMDESTKITLQELESGSDTYFYGIHKDSHGDEELVVLNKVKTDVQRIPVSIDRIPQHVRDAFVYTEDERFYTHDGVDYKRTFSAFLNMFMHIYDTEQGGSTITQQLIKNLTGDDEHSPQRKIREIFSAMQLEKSYTKDEILEEYLNYIAFGGPVNGIQLASIRYFGKNVEDLSVPEAAVLAAIPKSPEYYGPFVEYYDDQNRMTVDGRANNKSRKEYVLYKLYENGAISYDEYQKYLNVELVYTDSEEYLASHPEELASDLEEEQKAYSWVVDAMYYEVADYFKKQYNIDQQEAIKRINKGGYKIYSCIDEKMQSYIEERFLDPTNLISTDATRRWADIDGDGKTEEYLPHVAFAAMNYSGEVLAVVGDWGEKTTSLSTNYAVHDPRQVGSTMKPVAAYGLALDTDLIHWGSVFNDKPIMKMADGKPWPTNYGNTLSYANHNVYYFLQQSFNTVPAQLVEEMGAHAVYKFCKEQLGMNLDPEDEDIAPLALGALTYGITLENLVNAYLPYGNKGVYNEAHIVTKIEDSNQQIIYQNNGNPRQAVSDETAWVMNRLLKNVVQNGTGTAAQLSNKVVVGKTGTTDNWYDEAFVGLTRDFVSGITVGYKYNDPALSLPQNFKSAQVWKNCIGDYANTEYPDTGADFDPVESCVEGYMCTGSGCIASASCPKGVYGYWKSSNAPFCNGTHNSWTSNSSSSSNTNNNNNWYANNNYTANNNTNTWSNNNTWNSGNTWDSGNSYDNSWSGGADTSGGGDWSGGADTSGGGDWSGGADTSGGGDAAGGGEW
ncbi:MAG: transglycosylase domain-containing protein [Ruminococcus sp.]|nr:transglycosylase domain-containing protein [Ruminococcus sp.]